MKCLSPLLPALLVFGFIGCAEIKSLELAGINKVEFQPLSLAESELAAEILVYNPNKRSIYVDRWQADIFINDRQIANYSADSSFVIGKMDTLRYPLNLKVSNLSLLGGAIDFAGSGKKMYRIKGNARAGTRALKITMPFDESGEIKL